MNINGKSNAIPLLDTEITAVLKKSFTEEEEDENCLKLQVLNFVQIDQKVTFVTSQESFPRKGIEFFL